MDKTELAVGVEVGDGGVRVKFMRSLCQEGAVGLQLRDLIEMTRGSHKVGRGAGKKTRHVRVSSKIEREWGLEKRDVLRKCLLIYVYSLLRHCCMLLVRPSGRLELPLQQ